MKSSKSLASALTTFGKMVVNDGHSPTPEEMRLMLGYAAFLVGECVKKIDALEDEVARLKRSK